MNLKNNFIKFGFLCFIVLSNKIISIEIDNPYQKISYKEAFEQEDIFERNKYLLKALDCSENIFPNETNEPLSTYDQHKLKQEIQLFENNCLIRLKSKSMLSLFDPLGEGLKDISWGSIHLLAANTILSKNSYGNSRMRGILWREIIETLFIFFNSIKTSMNKPENPLGYIETTFAKNKCYIPRDLWPKIIKEFEHARNDYYYQDKHINFLEFALGFTTYKTKPLIQIKDNFTIDEIKSEINKKIDKFFDEYSEVDSKSITLIKLNVTKFIDALINNQNKSSTSKSRYLYFYGPHGIGKTHFVQKLAQDINELIPNSILYSDLIINSGEELEGTSDTPGAFLKVLRNQLIQDKLGSIVVIDEATWLNNKKMLDVTKRTFNGDRSKLITTYFGTEFDGTGISIKIPPMLIFLTNNENINDPALESRFDIINFPIPNKQALINYAFKIANESEILKKEKYIIDRIAIENWVNEIEKNNCNYRYIQANIETFIVKQNYLNINPSREV